MAEYEHREKDYGGTLDGLITGFTTSIVNADSLSKHRAAELAIDAFDAGNFDLISEVSLIGLDTPLRTSVSVPKALIMNLNPIVISNATMKTSMSVSAATESESSKDVGSDMEGKGTGGFGPVKVSVSVKAHTAVHSSQKRKSDYRSSCDTELIMEQGETPEGINRLLDAMLLTVDKGMEINEKLIDVQAQQLTREADAPINNSDDSADDDFSDNDSGDDDFSDNDSGNGADNGDNF